MMCNSCNTNYAFGDNKFYFSHYTEGDVSDFIDKIKFTLKKYHKFYSFLTNLIAPFYYGNVGLKKFIDNHVANKDVIAFNLGSGNGDVHPNISNVDIFKYDNVNMTADVLNLPIQDNTVDIIINNSVLEHIPSPEAAVSEFHRILKSGGLVFCFFPFIMGFHASPYDFSRRTIEGMKVLFQNFEILEIRNAGGPTSGFLWIFQEYVAILFSFGIKPLYLAILFSVMALTFPLKFLDIVLARHPMGKNITAGFVVVAKKNRNNKEAP